MKNKVFYYGMFCMVLVFGMMIICCKEPEPVTKTIKYQVTGENGTEIIIAYGNAFGNPDEQKRRTYQDITTPWECEVALTGVSGNWMPFISVYSPNPLITIKIFVDGTEVKTANADYLVSSGYFAGYYFGEIQYFFYW